MKGKLGRALVAASVGSAMVLGIAAMAWACTAQTRVFGLSSQVGPTGSQVVIKGEGVPAGSPVEIRWDALEGAKIAETTANQVGAFSAAVTIPESSPDIHFLIVKGQSGIARAAFEVTAAGTADEGKSAAQTADLWNGFSSARGNLGSAEAGLQDETRGMGAAPILATVAGLGMAAFVFGAAAGARRRKALS